jgi:ankyrin repeat protein
MFTGGTRHLELLFKFGLGEGGTGVWAKRSGNAESPTEMLVLQVCWAAKYNQFSRLKLLVQHGVDLNTADRRHHRTPYELAVLNGNSEIADYLLAHGAKATAFTDADSFFAACMNADEARARTLLSQRPTLIQDLGKDRAELLQLAAEHDKRDAIRLMAELGFDLNEVQRTAVLHHAAMAGHLEMVQLLIELGADPTIRDTEFNARPIGWAEFSGKTMVVEFLKKWEEKPPS